MPPKKDIQNPTTIEDLGKMIQQFQTSVTSQLSTITVRLDSLESLHSKFDELESKFENMAIDNTTMKGKIQERDETIKKLNITINHLESSVNRIDQYNRSWSVRIFNINLTESEESNPIICKKKAYNVFLPMLEAAAKEGLLATVPTPDQLLEVAHVLPGKAGQPKPMICRFLNRDTRSICFRLKKDHAARTPAASSGRGSTTSEGRFINPFFEDLSRHNFSILRDMNSDSRVQACWSVNGSLRYRLVNSDSVKKVPLNATSIDEILK